MDPNTDVTQLRQDMLTMLESMYEIIHLSNESEVVRVGFAALTRTQAGLTYLSANPIVL